jgi:hypothetical protein
MSPKKPIKFPGRPARKGVLLTTALTRTSNLPPLFLTLKLRKSMEKLLPTEHHQRLRLYFDTYGCLHCAHKATIYGGNGFCRLCLGAIGKRLKKVDKALRTRLSNPPTDLEEVYLRPYSSARRLLADLIPKLDKRLVQRKPEPKSPTKVYMKWLTQPL